MRRSPPALAGILENISKLRLGRMALGPLCRDTLVDGCADHCNSGRNCFHRHSPAQQLRAHWGGSSHCLSTAAGSELSGGKASPITSFARRILRLGCGPDRFRPGPFSWPIARIGMIAVVAVGFLHLFMEALYVSRGKGVERPRLDLSLRS